MATAPRDLRLAVLAQLRPKWIQALKDHPVTYKIVGTNGRIVRKRALPTGIALQLVEGWIPEAIDAVRMEANNVSSSLALWDQAQAAAAAPGNGGDLEIVSEDEDEED